MPSRSDASRHWSRLSGPLVLLLILAFPLTALAAERTSANVVLVDTSAVVSDDLYAAGNRVVVQGRVEGDLIATAFQDVLITGTVTGDVLAGAGSVHVSGTVEGSVRAVASTVVIDGTVGKDVVVGAWDATVDGRVAGDALVWGNRARVAGTVGGVLEGQTRRLALGGELQGGARVTTGRLSMEPNTVVGGDLTYRSKTDATGLSAARVDGVVVHRRPLAPNVRVRALIVLAKVVLSMLAAVIGLLLMWAAPRPSERAQAAVGRSWWKAWLMGLGVMISPLLVVAVAGVLLSLTPPEAALPVVAVFTPLGLAVSGLMVALAFAAPTAVYPWMGRFGSQARGPVRAFLYATGVITLLLLLPWVGWVVLLTLVPIGIGGWLGAHEEPDGVAAPV